MHCQSGWRWCCRRPVAQISVTPNWQTYQYSPEHTSWNNFDTRITPANARSLRVGWTWLPPAVPGRPAPELGSAPTVVDGTIFIATRSGYLYALDEATGVQRWVYDLGVEATGCPGEDARGQTAQPAVYPDPTSGRPTVYAAASTGAGGVTLTAIDAATGSAAWSTPVDTQTGGYAWGSPLLSNGSIYVTVGAACAGSAVRGAVAVLDQTTGQLLGSFGTEPDGSTGATVSTTTTTDPETTSEIWAVTGTGPAGGAANSLLGFDSGLARIDGYALSVPFVSSPILFRGRLNGSRTTTVMVGACAADGFLYAFDRKNLARGPVWRVRINAGAHGCTASGTFDNAKVLLFQAGNATTIGGHTFPGSMRKIDTNTGKVVWQTGLRFNASATASMNGANVLAVPGCGASGGAVSFLDRRTGHIIGTVPTVSGVCAQPVFADDNLFVPTRTTGLIDLHP